MTINMNQKVLMGPGGTKFLRDAKQANITVFVWTVNDEYLMRWSIEKGIDAVLTDNPELFLKVRDERESDEDIASRIGGLESSGGNNPGQDLGGERQGVR
jgi:phosphatidylglycerol phospholipase C